LSEIGNKALVRNFEGEQENFEIVEIQECTFETIYIVFCPKLRDEKLTGFGLDLLKPSL
jgi:hypothetical protein